MKKKVLLTPEYARELLSKNYKNNRRVRQNAVNKIALDIKEGRWNSEISNYQDPIILTTSGVMANGQHRCLAVILTNMPVWIYVEYDAPDDIFNMLDGCTTRMAADFIDVPNKTNAATLAKIMCAVEDGTAPLASALQGKTDAKTAVTRSQIIAKINNDNENVQRFIRGGNSLSSYLYNKKTHIATALFLIDYVGRGDVLERFVSEGSLLTTSSSQINALRSYMGKCIANKTFKADQKWVISCVLSAYEAFRNDTEIRRFNSLSVVFSKYDKYIFETRESSKNSE